MSKRKKLSSQLNNVFNAANDSFSPLSLGNLAAWYKPGIGVTGTLTAANWADQSGNGRDLAQGTAGNQPIYLPYSGTPYAYLPGNTSNYFSTPDSVAASNTGDIDIRVKAAADDWSPAAGGGLISKGNTAGVREWEFFILAGGTLRFNGAGTDYDSTAVVPTSDAAITWLRVTRVASSGAVNFYTGTESSGTVTWTQLGNTVTAGAGALTDSTNTVLIGLLNGLGLVFIGKIYRAQMFKTIGSATSTSVDDAAASVDFDPATFSETSTNGTTATMSTGEVWTLNSTGAYPATIVKSSQILFGGVDEYLNTASFSINQPVSIYLVMKQVTWTSNDVIYSGTNIYLHQKVGGASPQITASAGTPSSVNSNLAVGSYGIVTTVFNGASSTLQVNNTTAVTGDFGSGGISGGFWLGDYYSLGIPSNIIVKEVLIFSAAHTAAQRAQMQSWLNSRYGTF